MRYRSQIRSVCFRKDPVRRDGGCCFAEMMGGSHPAYGFTKAALEAGKHVLIEKPAAITRQQAEALLAAEKNSAAADDINKAIKKIRWTRESCSVLRMSAADFESCSFTARAAVIYDGLSLLKCPKRIPYSMIASFSEGARKVTGAGVVMERKHDSVFLTSCGSRGNEMSDSGFFVFVECPGRFAIGDESVTVRHSSGDLYVAENDDGCVSGAFKLPVVIRSGTSSDSFRTADGERKLLSKIFSEWRVPAGKRSLIPVFEDDENRGVWGSLFGYPDWFVKTN